MTNTTKITRFDDLRRGDLATFKYANGTKLTGIVLADWHLSGNEVKVGLGDGALNRASAVFVVEREDFVSAKRADVAPSPWLPDGARVRVRGTPSFLGPEVQRRYRGLRGVIVHTDPGSPTSRTVRWDDGTRETLSEDALRAATFKAGDRVRGRGGYEGTVVRHDSIDAMVMVHWDGLSTYRAAGAHGLVFVEPAKTGDDRVADAQQKLREVITALGELER